MRWTKPKNRRLSLAKSRRSSHPAAKLLDAGLLVFLVTALSLCMSTLYIAGLSFLLRFPIQAYFGLQDYLQVTTYWFGPFLAFTVLSGLIFVLPIALSRKPPKWFTWLCRLMGGLVILIVLASLFDWRVAFIGTLLLFVFYVFARGFADAVSGKTIRLTMLIGFPMATFAMCLGSIGTPVFLAYENLSVIYFSNGNSEVKPIPLKGKILFSLSQYLVLIREDSVLVAVPVGRIDRIETPGGQPAASPSQAVPSSSSIPTATPASKTTASPATSSSLSVLPTPQ